MADFVISAVSALLYMFFHSTIYFSKKDMTEGGLIFMTSEVLGWNLNFTILWNRISSEDWHDQREHKLLISALQDYI